MKKTISLWFTDFYDGFDPSNNFLYHLLSNQYRIELDPDLPQYLVHSCYGTKFLSYPEAVRIFYTGENLVPDFNLCDYAIGFAFLEFGDRYIRFPNFALLENQFQQLIKIQTFSEPDLQEKTYFCNFIYSNPNADPIRDHFFTLLNQYKTVHSAGRHLRNTEIPIGDRFNADWMYSKLDFQKKCRFTIAFENSSAPGYTTEKIMHAFIMNSIPIYWGNPEVVRDFNAEAFINCHDFSSFEEAVAKVKEIDNDPALYLSMLNQPPFKGNQIPEHLKKEHLENFLKNIFQQDTRLSRRRPKYGTTAKYERSLKNCFDRSTLFDRIRRKLVPGR